MTAEAIDKLTAGPVLDRLVAAKVMGWVTRRKGPRSASDGLTYYDGHCRSRWEDDFGIMQASWSPSTSMNDAAEVIGRLASGHKPLWCEMHTPFAPGCPCHAGFTPHNASGWNGRPDYRASGDTLPLAVCRAALKVALGHADL